MLPNGNLSDLMYPMTADIYYSTSEQSSFGEMVNTWSFDRVVNCSAIKERPDSSVINAITSEKFVWFEVLDEPTVFELGNLEPMFDPFHNFFGYRIFLRRADDQSCIL